MGNYVSCVVSPSEAGELSTSSDSCSNCSTSAAITPQTLISPHSQGQNYPASLFPLQLDYPCPNAPTPSQFSPRKRPADILKFLREANSPSFPSLSPASSPSFPDDTSTQDTQSDRMSRSQSGEVIARSGLPRSFSDVGASRVPPRSNYRHSLSEDFSRPRLASEPQSCQPSLPPTLPLLSLPPLIDASDMQSKPVGQPLSMISPSSNNTRLQSYLVPIRAPTGSHPPKFPSHPASQSASQAHPRDFPSDFGDREFYFDGEDVDVESSPVHRTRLTLDISPLTIGNDAGGRGMRSTSLKILKK
eukprot:GILI01015300.1.p1 GENE.GILI01015300.1~~GILI01015300.1.p1  ORF type:complete len:303 (-),score=13.57 GILI01015300.1:281-1189(-)